MAEDTRDSGPTTPGAEPPAPEKPEEPRAAEKPEEPPAVEKPEEPPAAEKPEEPPVTEKPVPTETALVQYLVSVDSAKGIVVKIERVDEKTGERRELTQEEYVAAYAATSYPASYYAGYTAYPYAPVTSTPAMEAYWAYLKAISDYVKTLTEKR